MLTTIACFSIGEVAEKLGVAPKEISDLLYRRKLDPAKFPRIGNRRVVPRDQVAEVRRVLREAGKLTA